MKLLSAAEEIMLTRRIERGDLQAKQRMIESNVRLVHAVAGPYRGSSVPFADLVQEGTIGLIRAVERFDHRRGVKFSTFAVWWIRRSILDAIASSNVIRMPAKASQQLAVRPDHGPLGHGVPFRAPPAQRCRRHESPA